MKSQKAQLILLILAAALYLYFPVWSVGHSLNNNDFKHLYLGMKALLAGFTPYSIETLHHQAALQGYRNIALNPYVYLPFTGYSMAFLAPFSLQTAPYVWFALNHIFMLASLYLLSSLFPLWRTGALAVLIGLAALNHPFYRTLSAGQLNIALLLMITGAFFLLKRHHARWAGFTLAFATLFKLMPGLYFVYFALRQKPRAAITMAISGLALFAAMWLLCGTPILLQFLAELRQMGYGKSTWPWANSFWDDPPNQSLNSFFTHILAPNDHTHPWLVTTQSTANTATIIVTLALIAFWLLRTTVRRRPLPHHFTHQDEAAYCATLVLALLIPSLMWDHYLVMLFLPVTWLFAHAIGRRRWLYAGLIAICYILTAIPWPFEAPTFRSGPLIIFMSLKLWPTLVLFGLNLCSFCGTSESFSAEPQHGGFPESLISQEKHPPS